uniref:Uncharacterized protein n=1 Tax=Romanomermis culicivorax TaxID=13658 RepID=A0A915JFD8_ROMCU
MERLKQNKLCKSVIVTEHHCMCGRPVEDKPTDPHNKLAQKVHRGNATVCQWIPLRCAVGKGHSS